MKDSNRVGTRGILIGSLAESFGLLLASSFLGAPFLIMWIVGLFAENLGVSDLGEIRLYQIFILISIFLILYAVVCAKNGIDENNKIIANKIMSFEAEKESINKTVGQRIASVEKKEEDLKVHVKRINTVLAEKQQKYPWLSTQISDLEYLRDQTIVEYLYNKKNPAPTAAKQVSIIAKEKRELLKACKMYEYQINYYETIFPLLEEFKELEPKEGYNLANRIAYTGDDEYDQVREWLSPVEYQNLSSAKKWQLALDRYLSKNKKLWEVGRDFERYIGYKYEKDGYTVKYTGALFGLEDRGRDVIAYKENSNLVIQCKRWAKEKTIHEKHIFQLFGSVVQLNLENRNQKYSGVFVTTATLSDFAKKCANYLKIECIEKTNIEPYPMIKCNYSSNGEKIYHLPFDQQYDRMVPTGKDFYAWTVKEAEDLGFRHAYRWHSNQE